VGFYQQNLDHVGFFEQLVGFVVLCELGLSPEGPYGVPDLAQLGPFDGPLGPAFVCVLGE